MRISPLAPALVAIAVAFGACTTGTESPSPDAPAESPNAPAEAVEVARLCIVGPEIGDELFRPIVDTAATFAASHGFALFLTDQAACLEGTDSLDHLSPATAEQDDVVHEAQVLPAAGHHLLVDRDQVEVAERP